jgi:hypothetical protein
LGREPAFVEHEILVPGHQVKQMNAQILANEIYDSVFNVTAVFKLKHGAASR